MPAWQNRQPRVQPRKISTDIRSCTVSASGTSGVLRIRPRVEVHDGVLADADRHALPVRNGGLDPAVRQVGDVVEARHVHAAGLGQAQQQLVPAAGAPGGLPLTYKVGDGADDLLAVAEHGDVDEVGDRFGVERRVPAGDDDRMRLVPVHGVQRDGGEVERGEHVGVAELGGERDAEQVEGTDRAVGVDGELADAVLAQQRLEIGPDGVGALGQRVRTLVEDLVEDLDALVGQARPRRRRGTSEPSGRRRRPSPWCARSAHRRRTGSAC